MWFSWKKRLERIGTSETVCPICHSFTPFEFYEAQYRIWIWFIPISWVRYYAICSRCQRKVKLTKAAMLQVEEDWGMGRQVSLHV
jgi:hypothetical protein